MRKAPLKTALWAWAIAWGVVYVAIPPHDDRVHQAIWLVGFGPFYVAALVVVYQWIGARFSH